MPNPLTAHRASARLRLITVGVRMNTLEEFINETLRISAEHGYYPTEFISMLERDKNTHLTIKKLVRSGDIQSGFKRLCDLGLKEYTVEAAVLKFPEGFTKAEIEAANWRLSQVP